MERGAGPRDAGRHHHAQLLHHLQRLPLQPARGVQPDRHEPLGRGLHGLHLHLLPGVRGGELPRALGPGPRHPEEEEGQRDPGREYALSSAAATASMLHCRTSSGILSSRTASK